MTYYDEFNEEQRRMFESDPYITGSGEDSGGCLLAILALIILIGFITLIFNVK